MDHVNDLQAGLRRRAIGVGAALLCLGLALPAAGQYTELPGDIQAESAFAYEELDLRVILWMDKSESEVYRKGESMQVGFQTNEDAYAVVYRIDTEGEVTVLWPRGPLDDGFVFGGHEYLLPVAGAKNLRASTREGEGFVEAVVSRYPFDLRRLELDFHHHHRAEKHRFTVAGDPFLAMNEVNFAITGLEDPGDYVVTNYLSYYVHREVEHPRYLCNQCHFDDDSTYHPYRDECELTITVDHRWSNAWWQDYGYFPVYVSPVYVYTDPWTWNPWVNFWYRPYWRCPPISVCYWDDPVFVWVDHPRYRGDCNVRWRDGHGGSPPLTVALGDGSRHKVREYGQVTPMVRTGARTKSAQGRVVKRDPGSVYRGEKAQRRVQDRFQADGKRERTPAGLRIKGGDGRVTNPARPTTRHVAGGGGVAPRTTATKGVVRAPARTSVAGGEPGTGRSVRTKGARTKQDTRIRTVDPRQRGKRIWNSQRPGTRTRQGAVRPGDQGRIRSKQPARPGSGAKGPRIRKSGSSGVTKGTSPGKGARTGSAQKRSSGKGSPTRTPRTSKAPTRRDSGASKGSRSGDSGRSRSGGGRSKSKRR